MAETSRIKLTSVLISPSIRVLIKVSSGKQRTSYSKDSKVYTKTTSYIETSNAPISSL
jgi:hypothetical protein